MLLWIFEYICMIMQKENVTEYMDSDLYSYAYQQLYMQPCTSNSIIYFGMISVKENGSYKLRCVFYDSF